MKQRRGRRIVLNPYLDSLQIVTKVLAVLIIILFIIFIYSFIKKNTKKTSSEPNTVTNVEISEEENNVNSAPESKQDLNSMVEEKENKEITINMALTGDIMCHNTIYLDAYDKTSNSYDFSYIFENIKYYIQTADISVGNLETTFAGPKKKYSSYPTFNTPESLAYNLKKLGFDVLSTANNHCYDSGYSGIESTINYLNDADIAHTGTYKSKEEQNKILIQNVKGMKIAFLSYTYGTNGIKVPNDKSYSVNLINKDLILKQLSLAKAEKPDLICACMHWGTEYQVNPNKEQKDLADFLFQNGVDIIIGNHPHILQPMETKNITLNDGTEKQVFVVYSLGNFIADQNKTNTRNSAILNLNITKNEDNKIKINSITTTPIYTYKDTSKNTKKFKLIDLANTIASYDAGYGTEIGQKTYNTFKTELQNVKKVLGESLKLTF